MSLVLLTCGSQRLVCSLIQALPPLLVPYLRLAHAVDAEELARPGLLDPSPGNRVVSASNEQAVLHQLLRYFERRLSQCALSDPARR